MYVCMYMHVSLHTLSIFTFMHNVNQICAVCVYIGYVEMLEYICVIASALNNILVHKQLKIIMQWSTYMSVLHYDKMSSLVIIILQGTKVQLTKTLLIIILLMSFHSLTQLK